MSKTVVFGGTFDPPHIGHRSLLENTMRMGYDRAIVIPDKIPPHKSRAAKDDFDVRFKAVCDLFADIPGVSVSDIENKREGKSYTSDTLEILRKKYPGDELFLLMGSDMLLSIEQWHNYKTILETTPIICAARTESDRIRITEQKKYLENKYKCNIIIYDFKVLEISSTILRSGLVKRIYEHNKANLSPSRLAHVNSVANYSLELATLHGINPQSAYIAALAHDCTKYMTDTQQIEYFEKNGIILTDDERACPKIYHQISGAHFAEHTLGIEDNDILNAIRWHTTGRENMSALEKLTCLADSIEPLRDYPGVEKMRKTAIYSIDKALLMSLNRLIDFVKERGLNMNNQTIKARDFLMKGKTMDNITQIVQIAAQTMYNKKGKDIRILKVDDVTVMADYFVICSGSSNTQLKALAGEIEFKLSESGFEPLHIEGYGSSDWVLLDYGSVIVHVFYRDTREYYNLERLWADGEELPLEQFVKTEETENEI